jgi:hypothetical protein
MTILNSARFLSLSKKELSALFNISFSTLNAWLEPHMNDIGEYKRKRFTPKQTEKILRILGAEYQVQKFVLLSYIEDYHVKTRRKPLDEITLREFKEYIQNTD